MATETRSTRDLGIRLTLVIVMLGPVLAATSSSAMPPTEPSAAVDEEFCDAVHPHPCPGIWTLGDRKDFLKDEVRVQYVRVAVPRAYSQSEADADPSRLAGSVGGPLADTIELEGWIGLPDLPGRAKAPVALFSTPYLGDCNPIGSECDPTPGPAGDDPTPGPVRELLPFDRSWWSDTPHAWAKRSWGVRPIDLVRRGYAAAFFSVRGTGGSGGCWENGGQNEQADQAKLVEWLADQPWSNGRVAMGGISAPALTALSAAKQSPKALKAIVISGITTDEYTFFATPQGAAHPALIAATPVLTPSHAFGPPLGGGPTALAQYASVAHDRLCPEAVSIQTQPSRTVASDRDSKYFLERRHTDDLGNVKAAVLLAHGFRDSLIAKKNEFSSLHTFQEDNVWKGLTKAPKRMVEGQWGHEFPVPEENPKFPEKWSNDEWSEILFNWLDYWLKGIGHPENLNKVDYQDQLDGEGNEWHQSESWPPSESKHRTFYLSGDGLSEDEPSDGSKTFRAAPQPLLNSYLVTAHTLDSPFSPWAAVCKDSQTPDPETRSLLYASKEQDKDLLIAGNPRAELSISSDLPGGIVGVHLVRLGKNFSCERAPGADGFSPPVATQETSPAGTLHPTDIEVLAVGAADLRFYKGNFKGEDFGVNQPTPVKIDLSNLAARVPAGSRLALILSAGDFVQEWGGQPYYPKISVHSEAVDQLLPSRLILPVVPTR